MGQAKKRGTLDQRVSQAKEKVDAATPKEIICNQCGEGITDIALLDTRGMRGVKGAYSGICKCGHTTLAMQGEPKAVALAMSAYEDFIGERGIVGAQLNSDVKAIDK